MKFWIKILLALVIVGIAFVAYLIKNVRPCNIDSTSTDGLAWASCLPFNGKQPHELDRCVRLYISAESYGVWQTRIYCDGDIRIVWLNDSQRSFSLYKGADEVMTWSTIGPQPVCTRGANLITYDPHELWGLTGRSTPDAQ